MAQLKMENGKLIPLTIQEQKEYDALQTEWPSIKSAQDAKQSLPDLATQVAHLIAERVEGTPLPDDVVAAANAKLSAIGQPSIAIPVSLGVMTIK